MKDYLKKTLLAGLITLLPIAGTLWLIKVIIYAAEGLFEGLIPYQWRLKTLTGYDIPGMGILAALIVIFLVGLFTRLVIGKRFIAYGDRLFQRIPFGRGIYTAIKQFIETVAGSRKSFQHVVLVEYPSPGSFALGFWTGWAEGEVQAKTQERMANVFLPTTPNPTSGYLLLFPESKMTFLSLTVD
ncbi:MAG: DUF502 domain-containing protein, partial [bacterium]|nr:DUF502 domain-containing protein [bacterium]